MTESVTSTAVRNPTERWACLFVTALALAIGPSVARGQEPAKATAPVSLAASETCRVNVANWRTSLLVEPASNFAALGIGDVLRKIGGRTLCLGGCAAECGSRAYPCILRPTPSSIAACFAFRCGPRGARCVRDCF